MSDNPRSVRATLRCLGDLGIAVPPKTDRIEELNHAVLDKAAELAPAHPENQVRIQAIKDTMVFRFTHGRHRVATWLDETTNTLWVCGADLRRENEGYDYFIDRHARDELLPGEDDQRRREDEAILVLARTIRDGAADWVVDVREHLGSERRFALPGGAQIRFFGVRANGEVEIWAAIPTLLADELGLPASVRSLIVAAITEALGGPDVVDFDERHEWPVGPLQNFEVAFFWLAN
jgi:hypothetical protein